MFGCRNLFLISLQIITVYLTALTQIGKAQNTELMARGYTGLVSSRNFYVPPHAGYYGSSAYPFAYPQPRELDGRFLGLHLHEVKGCEQKKLLLIKYWDCRTKDIRKNVECFFNKYLPVVLNRLKDGAGWVSRITNSGVAGYKGQLAVRLVRIVIKAINRFFVPYVSKFLADQIVERLDKYKESGLAGRLAYQVINTFLQAFPADKDCDAKKLKTVDKGGKTNVEIIIAFILPLAVDTAITTIPFIAPAGIVLSQMPFWPIILKATSDWVAEKIAGIFVFFNFPDHWLNPVGDVLFDSSESKNSADQNLFNIAYKWLVSVPERVKKFG